MSKSLKVGILDDMADFSGREDESLGETATAGRIPADLAGWIEREIGVLRQAGRFASEVEFLHAYALGLPSGTAEAVEQAYRQLADAGACLIVGPAIGDNAMAATPLAEQLRIPTLNWSAAGRARGRWMFQYQVGSHEDESLVIARHMASLDLQRVAVVHDVSSLGTRQLKHLESEAHVLGVEIIARGGISPLAEEATDAITALLAGAPDGVVYLGAGGSAPAVARALVRAGWDGPRMMNTAGLRGFRGDFAQLCDEWFYVDMHSGANATLHTLMADLEAPPRHALAIARGHDIGRLVAEGLARAGDTTREAVRLGLEQVKWLGAAQGCEGTLLGFGPFDHAALHGRYLVVRQWLGGESREVI
jgi:ABC-type branched-subunit amino acid transport system substrate-binding protein